MQRRNFLALVAGAIFSPKQTRADHHILSIDPLLVDSDLQSMVGRYTPVEDFYVRNHRATPQDELGSNLLVEGEVEYPQRLTEENLDKLEFREQGAVLECAGNQVATTGKVSNGLWGGWSLGDVLSLAHPAPAGKHVHLLGRDGFERSVPLDRARADGMLVTHLNQRRLTRNHGAPWRALFLGWYGMDSIKWLTRIRVSASPLPTDGTYQEVKSSASGVVDQRPLPRLQVKSVITVPSDGVVLHRGTVEICGLAWSGESKIAKVEVSADGGTSWRQAVLEGGSRYEWTLWRSQINLMRRGVTDLVCRATDERGSTQPAQRDPDRQDGYACNWYHHVRCVVV